LKAIPQTPSQAKQAIFQKTAGVHRLDKYGDFAIIDNLVKSYGGTYSHDDIFELDVVLVHNMLLFAKESAYIDSGTMEAQRTATN
jgi:hypothetical protein